MSFVLTEHNIDEKRQETLSPARIRAMTRLAAVFRSAGSFPSRSPRCSSWPLAAPSECSSF
jgi:hypothetical protein